MVYIVNFFLVYRQLASGMECGKLWWSLTLRPGLFQHYHQGITECFRRPLYFTVKNARKSSPIVARKSQDLRRNLSG